MQKTIFVLSFLALFELNIAFAQTTTTSKVEEVSRETTNYNTLTKQGDITTLANGNVFRFRNPSKVQNIEGSAYLDEKWKNTKINLVDGNELGDVMMRYNVFADEMEFLNEGKEYSLQTQKLKSLVLDGKTFIYVNTGEKKGFFEVLSNTNSCLFLKKHYTLVRQNTYQAGLEVGNTNKHISQHQDLYVKIGDAEPKKIGKNKKAILEALEIEDNKVFLDFIAENKLKFKTDEDIIKFVNFYCQQTQGK